MDATKREGGDNPLELLAEEVSATLQGAPAVSLGATTDNAAWVVSEFASFSTEPPTAGPGFDRIVLKKDAAWLPASGKSVKAGNLRFNLGKLFESAVSGAGVYFTAVTNPIFAVFTAIVAVRSLVKAATVDLEERDAWVLWAVWMTQGQGNTVDEAAILASIREQGQRYGHDVEMSPGEVAVRLGRLEKINAIRLRGGEWEVIETIVVAT
jgi:hypothetical protein